MRINATWCGIALASCTAILCAATQADAKEIIKVEPIHKITVTSSLKITDGVFAMDTGKTAPEAFTEVTEGYSSAWNERKYFDCKLPEDVQDHLFFICDQYNIAPSFVVAVIEHESSFRDWVIGDNGHSTGLMQIQERYHTERMERLECTDLLNPYHNITVGVDILAELFRENPDVYWVLMSYNGGRSYANRNYIEKGITSDYAKEIVERAEYYSSQIEEVENK